MPQPMAPAPDARPGWDKIKNLLLGGAQFAAGLAAPGPNTLGAAGIAGIRSMLPGSGSYRQELERYNLAAAPEDSVTDKVPMPGEDKFEFLRRWSRSPAMQRQTMETATMAAPIAVHASPHKWSGQPLDSARGTGEGGAAMFGGPSGADYLYHVTPEANAAAIAREGLRPDAPKIAEGGPHGDTRAVFLADEATYPAYQSLYGDDGLALFRVRRDQVPELAPDRFSEGGAFMTPNAIQPGQLERLIGGRWSPMNALDAEEALRRSGQATPEAYARIRALFDQNKQ